MADYAQRYSDAQADKLSKRLAKVYGQAAKEIDGKLKSFRKQHEIIDRRMREKVKSGEITEKQYKQWLKGQVFQGKQWENKLKSITETYVNADKKARELLGETSKNVFMESGNYQAYRTGIDVNGAVAFDMYDRKTVDRLIKDRPQLLPEWKIDEPKDYKWNYSRVNNAVTQGILQGESVYDIGKRLTADLSARNASKMDMFARTAITGAQNSGRIERLHEAEEMGIKVKKRWLASRDLLVRDAHADLDGVEVDVDEPFHSILGDIDYPGDPTADPANVYNCRCTLIYVYPEYKDKQHFEEHQTYEEWKEQQKQSRSDDDIIFTVNNNREDIENNPLEEIEIKVKQFDDEIEHKNKHINSLEEEYQDLIGKSIFSFGTDDYPEIEQKIAEIQETISKEYSEIDKTREEKSKYLSSADEQSFYKVFGKIEKSHSIEEDANAVNRISGDIRTQMNCSSCSLAYEARRRGIDCKAILMSGANNNNQVEKWFEDFHFTTATSYYPQDAMGEIVEKAKQWGIGSRGIVTIDYTVTTGHYFMFEVDEKGNCVFINPQSGSAKGEFLFQKAKPGSVQFARTDDKKLTRGAILSLDKGGFVDEY